MKKFAFISRHTPTKEQLDLATEQGIDMTYIGDADAFSVDPDFVRGRGDFVGVIVVHPAAALRLASSFLVGVFEHGYLVEVAGKPRFYATSLQIYDLRD